MISKKDFEYLSNIKKNCKVCGGTGTNNVILNNAMQHKDCECLEKIERERELITANIPQQYRHFDLRNLTRDFIGKNRKSVEFVKDYINNIEKNVEKGRGLWFMSAPGLGKSSIISCILKAAMRIGKSAYVDRASHLISLKFDALRGEDPKNLMKHIIDSVDVLAIEEIEKVYLVNDESMVNTLFFEFLSDIFDTGKVLLITSNWTKEMVERKFPTYICDRLSTLKIVPFVGKSERKQSFDVCDNTKVDYPLE